MDLFCVVPVTFEVTLNHGFERRPFNVRPGKTSRVEQHFPNVPSNGISVPDPKMEDLVPPEEHAFEMEGRKGMVDPGHPMGHTHVICILGLKLEFKETAVDRSQKTSPIACQPTIGRNP